MAERNSVTIEIKQPEVNAAALQVGVEAIDELQKRVKTVSDALLLELAKKQIQAIQKKIKEQL